MIKSIMIATESNWLQLPTNFTSNMARYTKYVVHIHHHILCSGPHSMHILEVRHLVQNTDAMGMFLFQDYNPKGLDFPKFCCHWKQKAEGCLDWY